MTALTDTQRSILTEASQRPRGQVLPLPGRLKGSAADKVVKTLLARSLVEKAKPETGEPALADGATLVLTRLGFEALGVGTDEGTRRDAGAPVTPGPSEPTQASQTNKPAERAHTPRRRAGTKQAALIAMLEAPEGTTVAEIAEALGWQHHTVRGAIAGALRKRLGLTVEAEKVEDRGRVYRIAG